MTTRLEQLARRRESLVSRSANEREQLAQVCHLFEGLIGAINFGVGLIDSIKRHPAAVAGLTAFLVSGRWNQAPIWLWIVSKIFCPSGAEKSKKNS